MNLHFKNLMNKNKTFVKQCFYIKVKDFHQFNHMLLFIGGISSRGAKTVLADINNPLTCD